MRCENSCSRWAGMGVHVHRNTQLYEEVCLFIDSHNRTPVGVDLDEPIQKLLNSKRSMGISGNAVKCDDRLLIATSPPLKNSQWKVNKKGSIFIDELDFYNKKLIGVAGSKREIGARRDPANPYVVYANVNGEWISCKASRATVFNHLSSNQQMSEALRVPGTRSLRDSLKQMSAKELAISLYQADIERSEIEEHARRTVERGSETNAVALKKEFLSRLESSERQDTSNWEW